MKGLGATVSGGASVIDISYADLVSAIGGSALSPGQLYKITDFATVHWMTDAYGEYILDGQEKIIHTGETEPLIVFATSSNTLAQEAYSPSHPEDIIRYDWDNSNWQGIMAFYDNGTSETVPGWKGVIYRREDNLTGNRCNFDFREITYRVWNIEQEAWDELTEYTAGDFVQVGTIIYWALDTSTDVEPGVDEGWEDYWKVIIDLDDGDGGMHSYFVLRQSGWYSGIVEDSIQIVDIEDYVDRTMFDGDCYYNVFDEYFHNLPYTIFGTSCDNNTFGSGCLANTFGSCCITNTFGSGCLANTFGSGCVTNTFPTLARYNEFKNDVSSLDCSAFTAVYDTNVTHQIGTSGIIYQTYIDESGTPAMVISTEKIGIYSD